MMNEKKHKITENDKQFVEERAFKLKDIERIFRYPPPKMVGNCSPSLFHFDAQKRSGDGRGEIKR